ncbi:MAG: nucleotidyl transferase AbiEii/AbiGii toxin family protein [Actinomycetales bacterium]
MATRRSRSRRTWCSAAPCSRRSCVHSLTVQPSGSWQKHPRDLYDVWRLYEGGTVEPEMLSAFVVYLCGHNRPAHEVLDSPERLLVEDYERALVGMIRGEIPTRDALLASRARLRKEIKQGLSESDRAFLIGFLGCEPDWALLPYLHASELPALNWKLRNPETFRSKRPDDFAQHQAYLNEILA